MRLTWNPPEWIMSYLSSRPTMPAETPAAITKINNSGHGGKLLLKRDVAGHNVQHFVKYVESKTGVVVAPPVAGVVAVGGVGVGVDVAPGATIDVDKGTPTLVVDVVVDGVFVALEVNVTASA